MLKELRVKSEITINEALKKLSNTAEKVLLIVDANNKLIGTLTDGDIRRAILSGKTMEESISTIYNQKPIYITQSNYSPEAVKNLIIKNKIGLIPILDNNNCVIDFVTWDQLIIKNKLEIIPNKKIKIPVVIMAGGKGSRLEPFTKVLPKPLIPVGNKTIAEHIMSKFQDYGADEFYFTLNYRGEMIKAYFESTNHKNLKLHYIFEDDFYGTAGSLKLVPANISEIFIVSNCDIIVNTDYAELIEFHKENDSVLTVVSAFQHHTIPYGVIKFKENGIITDIIEKPEKTVLINTGVYVVNKEILNWIPEGVQFHMTDLIEKMLHLGKKVCTYPVNSDNYVDVGEWDEYRKTIELMKC